MSDVKSSLERKPGLLPGYRSRVGVHDELYDGSGALRPAWRDLVPQLSALAPVDLLRRRDAARRLLREHGVTYNVYGSEEGLERGWSLDLIPFCVAPEEWAGLERALVQRTRLLDRLLGDLYGEQRSIREGWIPAAMVHGSGSFLRACHELHPPGGRHLYLHAVDLARRPDGRWCVLADRTQAPSGAGYALENRIILSRVLPDEFRECGVARLAGFFAGLRDGLRGAATRTAGTPNVVLLTPGPYNETYFEHAYLARYLGFPLVEGGDLTVRDRRVYLKTLEGLRPVDVILRRVDDTFCDPLELRAESFLGVSGLVDAARAGNVVIANALGSGLVESPAFLPFLPELSRRWLGQELMLPSAPAWWAGQEAGRRAALASTGRVVWKRTFGGAADPVFSEELEGEARRRFLARLEAAPAEYVAQERVDLSTTPVWNGETWEPRPLVLRTYVAANGPDSWVVMPGGLTRFSPTPGSPVVSAQRGGGSKDTWVLSSGPVDPVTLLKPGGQVVRLDRAPADVPSRVADNLYWLGRYTERLEHQVRLLRATFHRLGGETTHDGHAELTGLVQVLVSLGHLPDRFGRTVAEEEEELAEALLGLLHQANRPGSVRDMLLRLRYITTAVRDRLSNDTWRIFQRLQGDGHLTGGDATLAEVPAMLNTLVVDLAAFSGMEMENMTRGHAWRFLDIGRRVERSVNLLELVRAVLHAGPSSPSVLAPLLEVADSVMTYRRRYFEQMHLGTVLDLLLADESNPRALAFQLETLHEHIENLPKDRWARGEPQEERSLEAVSDLLHGADLGVAAARAESGDIDEVDHVLRRLSEGLCLVSDHLTHRFFSHAVVRAS
jgi:uncharacterized circularly permuted ATP-grasp superfamily protein/uncharacterized alpha-E superfamily protein